jgi:hypothetical protein
MNRGQVPLDFQSLCVHVEHLRVYRGSNHLWTNEVNITYKGDEQPSEIRYVDRIPKFEEPSMLISREREPSQKKIISKSFSIIKTITTFD